MKELTSGTVLRARRENIELHTEDGLTLVGELALPEGREPRATLVTLHPLPTHGGYMDSHVLRKASWRLPELADLAVLRFNTRGTSSPRGTSEGSFGDGETERYDVAAAMRFVQDRGLPNPWLVGWSFGTELALKHGLNHPIRGAILLSPPLRRTSDAELAAWADADPALIALVPEHDDFLQPAEARERFAVVPRARVIAVDDAKHLWVGEKFVRRVLDEIVAAVGTTTAHISAVPLPTEVAEDQLSG
ncbi:MAG: alpha/beta hydrolase [Actinobacteria bacterium]|nr:alpha/beta hydrolase [Actinomycetota bacterium]